MNDNTRLLRQVHPGFVQSGRITSQVFRPTPKDGNRLSCYNGDKIRADEAFIHFVEHLRFCSQGVMAVKKRECDSQDLPVNDDGIPFPEHCTIDFSDLPKKSIEKKIKELKRYAEKRGWLFQMDDTK